MKVVIDKDEWYPVFSLLTRKESGSYGIVVDVPDELYERWHKCKVEFQALQVILRELRKE